MISSKKEVRNDWLFVVSILALFVVLINYNRHVSGSLNKHLVVLQANVTEAFVLPKRGKLAYYNFTIKGRTYSSTYFLPAFKNINDRHVIVGHYFPVVADSSNYANNKMIFDSVAFAQLGLAYPDSLRWLQRYLK